MPKKKKKSGRLLGRILRFIALILLIGSIVVIWKPDLVSNQTQRDRVLGVRQHLEQLGDGTTKKAQGLIAASSLADQLNYTTSSSIQVGDQEIYVEDLLKALADELDDIPKEKFFQFKAGFCADLVATVSSCQLNE